MVWKMFLTEIVKLRKSVSSGNKFGLSDLWKNRASRRNKINIGDQTGKINGTNRKGRTQSWEKSTLRWRKVAAVALRLALVSEQQK